MAASEYRGNEIFRNPVVDRGSDPNPDQHIQPDLMDDVRTWSRANSSRSRTVCSGSRLRSVCWRTQRVRRVFPVELADQGPADGREYDSHHDIGERDAPVEDTREQQDRSQVDQRGGDQKRERDSDRQSRARESDEQGNGRAGAKGCDRSEQRTHRLAPTPLNRPRIARVRFGGKKLWM